MRGRRFISGGCVKSGITAGVILTGDSFWRTGLSAFTREVCGKRIFTSLRMECILADGMQTHLC